MQCVFHGIRLLRLIKIGCRETINFFYPLNTSQTVYPILFLPCLQGGKDALLLKILSYNIGEYQIWQSAERLPCTEIGVDRHHECVLFCRYKGQDTEVPCNTDDK